MSRHLAIIGGGPLCTYALERLSVLLQGNRFAGKVTISIFDRKGQFGAGATHSDSQPSTSYMNRVASQIAFGADEPTETSWAEPANKVALTFSEWASRKYIETGELYYQIAPNEIPQRRLHGQALREAFTAYVTALRRLEGVQIDLHHADVIDVEPLRTDRFQVVYRDGAATETLVADSLLFVTGHSRNRIKPASEAHRLAEHSKRNPPAQYFDSPYPLEERLTTESVRSGTQVLLLGSGLTAVDVILYLTEGRGGIFVDEQGLSGCLTRRYVRGGQEPRRILVLSPSGSFASCRPNNEKATDPSGRAHSAKEHQGIFLTKVAVNTLRSNKGVPALIGDETILQLDFERHVFPLVLLEMAVLYYSTLLGKGFGAKLKQVATPRYQAFLFDDLGTLEEAAEFLLEPLQSLFEEAVHRANANEVSPDETWAGMDLTGHFAETVFGTRDPQARISPWCHPLRLEEHRFDWRSFMGSWPTDPGGTPSEQQERIINFMRKDQRAAAQGNLRNPAKAASDGVWRDLRSVYSAAADFGGLTPRSHRQFVEVYLRLYGRMSNGIGLEVMSRVLALMEAGVVELYQGSIFDVLPTSEQPSFTVEACRTEKEVETVVEARSPTFDPLLDINPLFPNLMRRGLVRLYSNPEREGEPAFVPGGLDVTRDFKPRRADGSVEHRWTILGAPTERVAFFQLSAARPHSGSSVLANIAGWANHWVAQLDKPFETDQDSLS